MSGPAPTTLVGLRGPGAGSWQPVPLRMLPAAGGQPVSQGIADVTAQVVAAGAGNWWLTVAAGQLPRGLKQFAGWSLAVSYQLEAARPDAELAVCLGPVSLGSDQQIEVALGSPRRVSVGLLLWDGDRQLTGDSLRLASGQSPSAAALMCPDLQIHAWRTPGMDLLQFAAEPAGRSALILRSGADPLAIGLIGVLTSARR